ncbi:ATP-binding protein [Lutibacter sp. Hel_I_33_5]|uniref:sensor histidine kinase n=1 Tax=Lutibacter sp. Hel_I_33_5 TaxID=1566289 RepID=UPI0011A72FA0|nr:ATP-binding protein [Lutibacter sp. Hel_I_33_5]
MQERTKDLEEKNKDLEDFAHVVSHDLKRPLRNIMTLSHWLLEDNVDSTTEKNIKLINKQIEQMDSLINGVLNYSLQNQVSSDEIKVDLNALVNTLIELNVHKNCSIKVNKTLPTLSINKSQITQVFENLINNAIKYNDKDICEIEIDYTRDEKHFTFSIEDNGCGIEKKYHEKIFKLFQKLEVNKEVDSVGIGLALVKKIITRNNGEIYLKSKVGKGTTFYFTLPA